MNTQVQKTKRVAKRSRTSGAKMLAKVERSPGAIGTRWKMLKARWQVLKMRRLLGSLRRDGVRLLKLHPVPALVAAFAAGVAVTMAAQRS
jgi:hypothetical protein